MKDSTMETSEQEKIVSVPEAKVNGLLELYAEKVTDGQKGMAFGIRCAMKYLGIVTDEQIQDVLDPTAAKARARKERKQIKNVFDPLENVEQKQTKQRKQKRN